MEGERCGRSLAWILKQETMGWEISAIHDEQGRRLTDPVQINQCFSQFYTTIYSEVVKCEINTFQRIIHDSPLPKVSREERQVLNKPLTLSEFMMAITNQNNGKAPGLPAEVYKFTPEILAVPFFEVCKEAILKGGFPVMMSQATISLFLKKGKDPLECNSNRAIPLLACRLS